jgi:hypothetical protein
MFDNRQAINRPADTYRPPHLAGVDPRGGGIFPACANVFDNTMSGNRAMLDSNRGFASLGGVGFHGVGFHGGGFHGGGFHGGGFRGASFRGAGFHGGGFHGRGGFRR